MIKNSLKTTRRSLLGAAGLALATTGLGAQTPVKANRRTFVLVHGSWHGGWCWRRVSDLLEQKGHKVFTPTLTGLGERSNLLTKDVNATTHIIDVVNTIQWEDLSDVVLVGHSYGGIMINGVAERIPEKLSSIVFLDAFMPENGESLAATASQATRGIIEAAVAHNDLSLKSPPASVFGVGTKDQAWVDGKLTPHPVATFTEKCVYTGGRDKIARKMFIRAKQYASTTFDGNLAKAKSASWQTYEVASGHDVMVIQPEQLTELLLKA